MPFMKKITIIMFFMLFVRFAFAQTVDCNLTLITTIENFDVYEHNPSGSIMYKAKMYIDADGSPRAYGPNDSGLDWTANAGYPGNWWGIVTDGNGDPVIQGTGDPYPGMYVSTTSLVNSAYGTTNPLRYTNSETVPFFVLPTALVSLGGIRIGDVGYVYNTSTGLGCFAIYADSGPAGKLGEGSIYLAEQIGVPSDPRTGGTSSGIIEYIVFPQSGFGQGTIPTISQIDSIGTLYINSMGGIGVAGCLDNPINDPANLQATRSSCPANDVTFFWTNSGSNWHIDISTTSGFTNYWWKYISNATSYNGPAGFVDHVDGTTPLTFQNGTTYYWRVTNSNGSFNGPSFTFTACDNIIPTTTINSLGNWQTQDFTVNFSDADNIGGSGINESFYQVLDYDNAEWRGNSLNGFFNDNFSATLNPAWIKVDTTWIISSGHLEQTGTSTGNTNIYTAVVQDSTHTYLYHWQMMFNPGSNRRAGIYIYCSDPTLTQRGNSYMIWFRADDDKCQLYTVKNNSISTNLTDDNCTINDGVWYDCKTTYDPETGILKAYLNDTLISTYTDTAPLKTGSYISLRTGNADVFYDDIKVWKTRNNSAIVTVGAPATNDIRYQNPDPVTCSARINSLVTDSADNFSAVASQNINIDWTTPSCVAVNDGSGTDTDTTSSLTILSANWTTSADANSGINKYWYAIGSNPGNTDIINWTDNALNTSVTVNGLSLTPGQTYFFSVRSVNNADLICNAVSDGITVNITTTAGFTMNSGIVCTGETVQFTNTSANATSYQWSFDGGNPSSSTLPDPFITFDSSGVFDVQLIASGPVMSDTITQQITIIASPIASFMTPDTIINTGDFAAFTNNSTGATSYLWDFGDGNTSTDVNPWNIYNAMGDYTVTLVAYSTECDDDTLIMNNYIHVGTTGIHKNPSDILFVVQPNPFHESFTISFILDKKENLQITITDMIGKEIKIADQSFSEGFHSIPFENKSFAKGAYTIKFYLEKQISSLRLIKY
jgi:PKD repeat protein